MSRKAMEKISEILYNGKNGGKYGGKYGAKKQTYHTSNILVLYYF